MTIDEVKSLKGGDLVQDVRAEFPAVGVVIDARLHPQKNRGKVILLQFIGGGSQISLPEYHGWATMRKIEKHLVGLYA